MSKKYQPCPQCGAPLDADGYCQYHLGSRPAKPTIVPSETLVMETRELSPLPEWLVLTSLVVFTFLVFYTFLGRTVGFYEVSDPVNTGAHFMKAVTAGIIALYNYKRNRVLLTVLFSINTVLSSLYVVLSALD